LDIRIGRLKSLVGKRSIGGWIFFALSIVWNLPSNQQNFEWWERQQVSQGDVIGGKIKINIWLIDAFQQSHQVDFKEKSDEMWDQSFLISERANAGS
jgi:hypothetical protein